MIGPVILGLVELFKVIAPLVAARTAGTKDDAAIVRISTLATQLTPHIARLVQTAEDIAHTDKAAALASLGESGATLIQIAESQGALPSEALGAGRLPMATFQHLDQGSVAIMARLDALTEAVHELSALARAAR